MQPKRVKKMYYKSLPSHCKSVTRPSRFGNPIAILNGKLSVKESMKSKTYLHLQDGNVETCVSMFEAIVKDDKETLYSITNTTNKEVREALEYWLEHFRNIDIVKELKGYSLACFCKLDKPCHADILLEIANN